MLIISAIKRKLGIKEKLIIENFVEKYCGSGKGIEIGGAAHNSFDIKAKNVDICDHNSMDDKYYKMQMETCGKVKKVDIIARGDKLPLKDNSVDFVFSSHVIEHFYNPMSAIREWTRVVKKGGHIVMIVPNKKYTFDKDKECTKIEEFRQRDKDFDINKNYPDVHHSIWTLQTFLEFAKEFNLPVVDYVDYPRKLENSFAVAIRVSSKLKENLL